jgi:ketosteroid isomerase-like protein
MTTASKPTSQEEAERLVREQFRIIETGDLDLAEANVTPEYVNHRSVHEPLAARSGGPDALKATAGWLRRAFSELRFDIHDIAVIDDRVIAWVTLHGRNTGPFVVHDSPDGSVTDVFPPTGRGFAADQVHWFRIADGAIAEHDAVRDDLGMAKQVGWIPPRPGFILRMLIARRRERRAYAASLSRSAVGPQKRTTALTTGAAVLTTLITTGVLAYAVLAM